MSQRLADAIHELATRASIATRAELADAIATMGEGCLFDDIAPEEEAGAMKVMTDAAALSMRKLWATIDVPAKFRDRCWQVYMQRK